MTAAAWKCSECGSENSEGRMSCEVCGMGRDRGGLKCIKCGEINPPGQRTCIKCGEPLNIVDVTPENIGVELQDGRMAVVIKRNTAFPLAEPITRVFYTSQTNQTQCIIPIYQGPSDEVAKNEHVGNLVIKLPSGLPKGTAIAVEFNIDRDGVLFVVAQIIGHPDIQVFAHIARGGDRERPNYLNSVSDELVGVPRAIGIDLGTTNSVVAVLQGGEPKIISNNFGEPLTPSAVNLDQRGKLLVGKAAKARKDCILSIKRFMGLPYELTKNDQELVNYKVSGKPGEQVQVHFNNRTYTPTQISAMILYQLRQNAQERLGENVGRAVITVPAYFNDAQVAATRNAGQMAGFTVMRILREPTAAAMAFGMHLRNVLSPIIVYDLGRQAFDITILMMTQGDYQILGIEGDKHLGGDNFDDEIVRYIHQRVFPDKNIDVNTNKAIYHRLKMAAEEAKKDLSSATTTEIIIPAMAGVNIEEELSRKDFNKLIAPWIDRTIKLMHKALRDANFSVDMIDHILLVGGSTLMPLVTDKLHKEFGSEKIKKNIDPMLCVAFGAAIQTSLVNEIECPNSTCKNGSGYPTKNPIEATECQKCKTSLIGFDVVSCPACFVPTDAKRGNCYHCGATLELIITSQSDMTTSKEDSKQKPMESHLCELESRSSKCDHNVTGTCVQCGKRYCALHGGAQSGYGARCRDCYVNNLHALVVSHSLSGSLATAIEILQSKSNNAAPEHKYYYALALAANNDLDQALNNIQPMLRSKGEDSSVDGNAAIVEKSKQLACQILSARATRHIRANNIIGATDDLHLAVEISPENTSKQQELLSSLVHQSAFAYFQAGRLSEALETWEEIQSRNPQDLEVAHYIAVLSYKLASEYEEKKPAQADDLWKNAIANWVMVLSNAEFWSTWAQKRSKILGGIDDDLIKGTIKETATRLESEFRNYRARYLKDQGSISEANRHANYEVAFVRERRTAEEMAQVLLKKSSKRLLHVACGPLMLDKWRNYKAGEDLITAVNSIAKAALTLEIYLSSIGIGYTMVKDMKPPFYEESVPVLQDLLKTERNNNLAKDLLAEALIERSKLLIGVSDFENAVALLEQATTYKREEAIIKSLSDAATKYARALLDDETNIQKAIDLLERLRSKFSISDYEFKAQLSISYFTRGAVASHKNQYQSSLNDIRTALQIDPQNEAAKKYMVRALENRARELSNESKYNEAIALMNEAIAYDSEQVSSALIASILFGRGIDRANAAIQAHSSYTAYRTRQELNAALEDLQTALKLDPANASHIQNQINALRISLSRL